MDAIKILGSLLANGALSRGSSGGNVLGNVLGAALGGGQNSGMGGMLGSLLGGGQQQGGGALGSILGSVLGGGQQQQSGGLGGLLGSALGGGSQQQGGGLGGMLGSMLGGQQQGSAGGMGDLLGSLMGGAQGAGSSGGLGDLLGASIGKFAETKDPAAAEITNNFTANANQDEMQDQAKIVIRAMINAAKADGKVDEKEQANILEKLGNDVSPDEAEFVQQEFNRPLNIQEFVNDVPRGMEQQIYLVSLLGIDLDTQDEAKYLAQLAQALSIDPQMANQIHEQVGAPKLFS